MQIQKKVPTNFIQHPHAPLPHADIWRDHGTGPKARNWHRDNAVMSSADDTQVTGKSPKEKGLNPPTAKEGWGCQSYGLKQLLLGSLPSTLSAEEFAQREPTPIRLSSVYFTVSRNGRAGSSLGLRDLWG